MTNKRENPEKDGESSAQTEETKYGSWSTPEELEVKRKELRERINRNIERALSGDFTREIRELRRGPFMACPGVGGPPDDEGDL